MGMSNPFEITRTEYYNSNFSKMAKNFQRPNFYRDLVERDRFIIVGSRGTGKTMILKSLYLPIQVELNKLNGKKIDFNFIGVYVPFENLELATIDEKIFKYLSDDIERGELLWKNYTTTYFSLLLTSYLFDTIIKHGHLIGIDLLRNDEIISKILEIYDSGLLDKYSLEEFKNINSFFKKERINLLKYIKQKLLDENTLSKKPTILGLDFLNDVAEILIGELKEFSDYRFYILLDDFFPPFVSTRQQKILLDLVRQRGGFLSFKIATIPEGMPFVTESGYELRPDLDYTLKSLEFRILGKDTKKGRDSEYLKLIKDITDSRLKDYLLNHTNFLANPEQTYGDFLRKLRGEETKKRGHDRPIYAGFNTVVALSSGIVGSYLLLVREMINERIEKEHKVNFSKDLCPIPIEIQDEVIRKRSHKFLESIKSLEKGQSLLKLVSYIGKESRKKFLKNLKAKEYLQVNIKNYEELLRESKDILIIAYRNNILQTPEEYQSTARTGQVVLESFILNRLLTPAFRIPYRERWKMDMKPDDINNILLSDSDQPLPITKKPLISKQSTQSTLARTFCPIFSENCIADFISKEKGGFLALPFRDDWHIYSMKFLKDKFDILVTSLDISPNGDFTCKICEAIHNREWGIYEITYLNDNVFFELGLSLSNSKHTFLILNKEEWENKWCNNQNIKHFLSTTEVLPYFVTEESIENDIFIKVFKSLDKKPWNEEILENEKREKKVFIAMPISSRYYKKTLRKEVIKVLKDHHLNFLEPPSNYAEGLTIQRLFQLIVKSDYCIIDTTMFPHSDEKPDLYLDYVWRTYSLGIAVGLKKPLIHCYNASYTQRLFSDMRGKCTFIYKDLELKDKLDKNIQEMIK